MILKVICIKVKMSQSPFKMFVIDNNIHLIHPGADVVLHPGNLKPPSSRAF